MKNYAQRMERLFNQARFRVDVANAGKMQAEHLLIEVSVSSGWLHDRYVVVSPSGPSAPIPRDPLLDNLRGFTPPIVPPRIGRHDFTFKNKPGWRSSFSVTCEDFRRGVDWTFEGILGIDPRETESTITVTVTASNLRGNVQESKRIERKQELVHVSKLIDLDALKITVSTPIDETVRSKDYEEIDWKAFTIEEEE